MPGDIWIGYQEKFLHLKCSQALEQVPQESGGITTSESIQNAWECDLGI